MNGYKLYRSDRNFKKENIIKGGGGVCAFIKENLKVKYIGKFNKSGYNFIDFMILEIISKNIKILFTIIYRHGDCTDGETNDVLNKIMELSMNYEHVIVSGDLNANAFDGKQY